MQIHAGICVQRQKKTWTKSKALNLYRGFCHTFFRTGKSYQMYKCFMKKKHITVKTSAKAPPHCCGAVYCIYGSVGHSSMFVFVKQDHDHEFIEISCSFIFPLHICDYLKLLPLSHMAFRVPQKQTQWSNVQDVFLQKYNCYMINMDAPCLQHRVHSESSDLSPPSTSRLGWPAQNPALDCRRPQICEGSERDLRWARR